MSEDNVGNGVRNLLIVIIVFIIILGGLFVIYSSTHKNQSSQNQNLNLNESDLNLNLNNLTNEQAIELAKQELLKQNNLVSQKDDNTLLILVTIFIILILIGGIVVYFYFFKQKEENKGLKQPVPINEIKDIFKEKISKEYGLAWYVDMEGKFRLKDDREFYYKDQRVWFHRATGDKFLTIEFIINNGPMYGLHIATIPADKGRKTLEEGEWNIIHKTDMKDFKLMSKTYPVTSLTDKKERQQMYIAEQLASGEIQKNSIPEINYNEPKNDMSSMKNTPSRTKLISPFSNPDDEDDIYGEEDDDEMNPNVPFKSTRTRRTNTRYRRR